MSLRPRAVVVHRRTELDELLDRHGTRGQAEFFLRTRGRTLEEVQCGHDAVASARATVAAAVPGDWALAEVERADLARFLWAPEDVVVVVGQDGLVANVAKYLDGQPVVGVDPAPGANPGVLVRHAARDAARLLAAGDDAVVRRGLVPLTMVRARLDDGQELLALNEVFVGHPSHQSARYRLAAPAGTLARPAQDAAPADARRPRSEDQSSSGVIVGTGTGATGWCASLAHDRGGRALPGLTDDRLAWFVREAWPSPTTRATLTEGSLGPGEELAVVVRSDGLVVFGDGMESDRLVASWGQEVRVGVADRRLRLVV